MTNSQKTPKSLHTQIESDEERISFTRFIILESEEETWLTKLSVFYIYIYVISSKVMSKNVKSQKDGAILVKKEKNADTSEDSKIPWCKNQGLPQQNIEHIKESDKQRAVPSLHGRI